MGFKTRNPYGEVQDTDSTYKVRDVNGTVQDSTVDFPIRNKWGERSTFLASTAVRDAYGNAVLSGASYSRRNAWGEVTTFTGSVPEPLIASFDSAGNMVATTTALPTDPLNVPFVVRYPSYNSAGVLTTWDDTNYLTLRQRTPGANTINAGNNVIIHKPIIAGATFPNQISPPTGSTTRTPPRIEVRWMGDSQGNRVIGDTDTAKVDVMCAAVRDGSPAARVEVIWSDGTNSVTAVATVEKYTGTVSGLTAHQWSTGVVNIATLSNGMVTRNWKVYGHHGQLITASDLPIATAVVGGWQNSTQYMRKLPTMAASPVYVYVLAGAANDATTATASTTEATARANPFSTLSAAMTTATRGAQAVNNTVYSINACDGVIARHRSTGANLSIVRVVGSFTCLVAGFIIEPDPLDDYSATGGPTIAVLPNFNMAATSTNPNADMAIYIRGFHFINRGSEGTWGFTATGAQRVHFEGAASGSTWNTNVPLGLFMTQAHSTYANFTFTNWGAASSNPFSCSASEGLVGMFNCDGSNIAIGSTLATQVNMHCIISSKVGNARLQLSTTATPKQSAFTDAVISEFGGNNANGYQLTDQNEGRAALARNCLFVALDSTEDTAGGLSFDGSTYSLKGFGWLGVSLPGWRPVRINSFYLDGTAAAAARDHKDTVFHGCLLPAVPSKGDRFGNAGVPDGAREPGWRDPGYGVWWRGNVFMAVWGTDTDNDAPRFYGIGSRFPVVAKTYPYDPVFTDNRQPTTIGAADGTRGGNYQDAATALVAYDRPNLWDILGRDLPTTLTRVGCYAGA